VKRCDNIAAFVLAGGASRRARITAMYRKDCVLEFSATFEGCVRRVAEALDEIFFEKATAGQWHEVGSTDMLFQNMNTPEDFTKA
jgi:hypothetical protein